MVSPFVRMYGFRYILSPGQSPQPLMSYARLFAHMLYEVTVDPRVIRLIQDSYFTDNFEYWNITRSVRTIGLSSEKFVEGMSQGVVTSREWQRLISQQENGTQNIMVPYLRCCIPLDMTKTATHLYIGDYPGGPPYAVKDFANLLRRHIA